MTFPAGTVAWLVVVMAPTVNPAVVIADCAAGCVKPTTFGTAVPRDTTRFTAVPPATFVPAAGF